MGREYTTAVMKGKRTVGMPGNPKDHRTLHFTEWRPDQAAWLFGKRRGAADR